MLSKVGPEEGALPKPSATTNCLTFLKIVSSEVTSKIFEPPPPGDLPCKDPENTTSPPKNTFVGVPAYMPVELALSVSSSTLAPLTNIKAFVSASLALKVSPRPPAIETEDVVTSELPLSTQSTSVPPDPSTVKLPEM